MLSHGPGPLYYGGDAGSFVRGAAATGSRSVAGSGSHFYGAPSTTSGTAGGSTADTAGRFVPLSALKSDQRAGQPNWIRLNADMIADIVRYTNNHPIINSVIGPIFK